MHFSYEKTSLLFKVSKGTKIRNRYNQVPHLTQDTFLCKRPVLTVCMLGKCSFLFSSADFFQNYVLQINHTRPLSECQTVWIQIKTVILLVFIWVQNCLKKAIDRRQNSPLACKEIYQENRLVFNVLSYIGSFQHRYTCIMGLQWVLRIWGEWLFIFREVGSTGSYLRGSRVQAHSFRDLGSPAKKQETNEGKASICLIF